MNTILKDYDERKELLSDFTIKMEQLLSELLKNNGIQIHQVSSRMKERSSLEKKIIRKEDKYKSLNEITDIVGIRIISNLESDINIIADIINSEFIVDEDNSIDKRKKNNDQFGYKSLHNIVNLNKSREKLVEYKRYKGLKFEIQIRSILQHAWAEIEHDLGYKGIVTIPDSAKRTFNRVSALLETADIEFDRLKKELDQYENTVDNLISSSSENVFIDQASLNSLNSNNMIMKEVREIVHSKTGCSFVSNFEYKNIINILTGFYKIDTIKELEDMFVKYKDEYLNFVSEFMSNKNYDELPNSVGIYYFLHFLSSKDEDEEIMDRYLEFSGIGLSGESFIEIIKRIRKKLH